MRDLGRDIDLGEARRQGQLDCGLATGLVSRGWPLNNLNCRAEGVCNIVFRTG